MIGHFLLTLKPEEEDRVLTQPMQAFGFQKNGGSSVGCLIEVAWGSDFRNNIFRYILAPPGAGGTWAAFKRWVPGWYDELCVRFGEMRINTAIRQRVLANRAARTLRTYEVAV